MATFYLYHHQTKGGNDVYRLSTDKMWASRDWQGRTIIATIEADTLDSAESQADEIIDNLTTEENECDPDAPYFCENCQEHHFDMCEAPRTPFYPSWVGVDRHATENYFLDMEADTRAMGISHDVVSNEMFAQHAQMLRESGIPMNVKIDEYPSLDSQIASLTHVRSMLQQENDMLHVSMLRDMLQQETEGFWACVDRLINKRSW